MLELMLVNERRVGAGDLVDKKIISDEFIETLKDDKYETHLDEIKDALSILDDAIESLQSCILDEAATLLKQRCFEKSTILSENTQALDIIRNHIREYITQLENEDDWDDENNNDSEFDWENDDQFLEPSQLNNPLEISKVFTLDQSVDVTYFKPTLFRFKQNEYEVNSWRYFLRDLCFILYKLDKEIILSFPNRKEFIGRTRNYFSKKQSDLTCAGKINTNLYVELNLSAKDVLKLVKKILKAYRIEPHHVEVEVRPVRSI
ncbi:hypothetical protein [Limnoraphis robusta]|uniref:Uncharacterized protein n=1 Tax=Limnoraphis robusta CS-951 TaxID=1637645 RepID=A0A0F5Y997_9CYAN|nr:hypothetical protein [Limnoraphis robusta]KKD35434.1 hypothetical protein WN50_25300 [Limnoraphis robusta CS-951]KMW70317.1 hypothetical protein WN50_36270 [Limnoraphis robusta CS-951]KMW70376.1 hypothetical protein WN50_35765 [Limnoraphis robusta CS-951]